MASSKLKALKSKVAPKVGSSKAKSKTPTVEAPKDMHDSIAQWREAKQMENEGKALREAAEGDLLDFAALEISTACRDAKKVVSSVNIIGRTLTDADGDTSTDVIQATQVAKYSKMDGEQEDKLRSIFTDRFERFFKINDTVTVKTDISDELFDRVVEALTKEFGDDIDSVIDITSEIKPTEVYIQEVMLDNSVEDLHKVANNSGLCKLQKISFKLK